MRSYAICGVLLVALCAVSAQAKVNVGDRLPDIALDDWQGHATPLTRFHAGVVVIDFWASWCTACREALPGLNAISQRHAGRGLTMLAINIDQSKAAAEQFLAERLPHPAMTLLRDPSAEALARFGAGGMPALYIVDRDGVVQRVEAGYAPDMLPAIEAAIVDPLGGR